MKNLAIKRLIQEMPFMVQRLEKGEREHGTNNIDTSLLSTADEVRQESTDVLFYVRELINIALPKKGEGIRIFLPFGKEVKKAKQYYDVLLEAGHYPCMMYEVDRNLLADNLSSSLQYMRLCQAIFVPEEANDLFNTEYFLKMVEHYRLHEYNKFEDIPLAEGREAAFVLARRYKW